MNKGKEEKEHNNNNNDKQKPKREFVTYKYSQGGKKELHEAILINGLAFFIKFDNISKQIEHIENIEETNRVLRPPNTEEYPYAPYEFTSKEELTNFIEQATKISLDEIYIKCKSIFCKYVDQDEHIIILLTADSIWTHFQDLFPVTHYSEGVGANDVGKSSIGYTFEYTGYRVIKGTAISGANYNRILGVIEPGQCIIIEDEGDSISEDYDKIRILKSGYEYNGKIPKINMNLRNQDQQWYKTYCYKMILAETSLSQLKAKGLVDRTFSFNCRPGKVEYSIKEVVSENINKNPRFKQLYKELLDYRKLMLCYRLVHYKDRLVEIETGLKNRDNELCKPLLQLFCGTEALQEIIKSLVVFINQRRERKSNSIEAALYPILKNLINNGGHNNDNNNQSSTIESIGSQKRKFVTLSFSEIWSKIVSGAIDGNYDDKKPNQYETVDYGLFYKNTLSKHIADSFGARLNRKANGSSLIFDLEKFAKFDQIYDNDSNNNSSNSIKIEVKLIENKDTSDKTITTTLKKDIQDTAVADPKDDDTIKNKDEGSEGSFENNEGICARNVGSEGSEGNRRCVNAPTTTTNDSDDNYNDIDNHNHYHNNNNDNNIHLEKENVLKSIHKDVSINKRSNNNSHSHDYTHLLEPTLPTCLHSHSSITTQSFSEPTQPTLLKKPDTKKYNNPLISESDLSSGGPSDPEIINNIGRFEGTDRWFCNNCSMKGDKWFMMKHPCNNNKKKKVKTRN